MTLFPWVREYIRKYSFVEKIEFKNLKLFIYYRKEDGLHFKKLPYRATKAQVEQTIERIKKEINYYEDREERAKEVRKELGKDKKPLIFAIDDKHGK